MGIKKLSVLAVLLINATGGSAGVISPASLPAGLPDGHYTGDGTIDPKTGYLSYTYLGPIEDGAQDNYVATSAESSANPLVRRVVVNCNARSAGDSVDPVQAAFASYWGGQKLNNYWVRTTQGSSMA